MTNKFDRIHTNTNKKYIIRNCPCFFEENEEVNDYTCAWNGTEELACQDCTDCVMKQIVEKCRYCINAEKNNKYKTNGWVLSDDILALLDIQEVE